ncbi:unnamed protein product (macronuclear) [Paramecium tetraurelia]|uniref:PUM-HD domain-containing protein n=1 Tax=Paramecium tetraurelia TaxID=5888 RepID=A0EHM8_PARTE|nr:uncharacterized protein GSPATT00027145001 [Paramecium tetraurelia]CAK94819.1 unnamed protein product [Paramecium tetraurelia]|eukprot:XP_001462192.1 hypothetical protein (macronuclear) [Paramecium tetraurelia strain d4-2]
MASQSEEKDLIGSILSDQDDKQEIIPKKARKNLSLKSKEFDPQIHPKHPEFQTSNASILSTGYQSHQKQRIFFQTQTSIEIQSQLSNTLQQTADQDNNTCSFDHFQSFDSFGQLQQRKQSTKKHHTMQPTEYQNPTLIFTSDQCIDGKLSLSQTDLEQICGNQLINRKLQNILDSNDINKKRLIFNQVEKICLKASKDMFGNYTVQKVFEVGSQDQKQRMHNLLINHIFDLSKNQYACRVVQKMMEFIKDYPEQLEIFLQNFYPYIIPLLNDPNGNYVILSCFELFNKNQLIFIIPMIEDSLQFMSKQTYGCRVIQKVLEIYPIEHTQKMMDILMTLACQLCYQEFGNYIIQYILKSGPPKEKQIICQIIKDNFEQLSINKFGSNSVEKYIDVMGPNQIINILCSISNDQFVFYNLSVNPFGNYVMKKVLISGDPSVQYLKSLLKQYPELVQGIKNSDFGQRVGLIMDAL